MHRRLVMTALAAIVIAGLLLARDAAWTAEPARHVRWDYKVVKYDDVGVLGGFAKTDRKFSPDDVDVEKGLNKLGEDGWELTGMVHSAGFARVFYLKRPKAR
jgi:hypothetical protein